MRVVAPSLFLLHLARRLGGGACSSSASPPPPSFVGRRRRSASASTASAPPRRSSTTTRCRDRPGRSCAASPFVEWRGGEASDEGGGAEASPPMPSPDNAVGEYRPVPHYVPPAPSSAPARGVDAVAVPVPVAAVIPKKVVGEVVEFPPPSARGLPGATAPASTSVAPPPLSSVATASSAGETNAKLANLKERTPPAVLALVVLALILKYAGTKGVVGLVLAVQVGAYSEATSVVERFHSGERSPRAVGELGSNPYEKWWWFATAIACTSGRSILTHHTSLTDGTMNLVAFGMAAVGLVSAVVQMAGVAVVASSPDDDDVENATTTTTEELLRRYLGKVAACHFALLFLVGQSSFWIRTVQEYGVGWVLFPALLVVVNDTMAYVFGVLMGKHKLLPRLSPKKTVEGFVGAALSTLAISGPLLRWTVGDDGDVWKRALAVAAYASIISPFGGFLASAVKRAHGAKDFGAMMPGHGGVVDRFDCQIVTAPFVYLYLRKFGGGGTAAA